MSVRIVRCAARDDSRLCAT